MDLLALWRPGSGLSPRYVLWIAEHLPPESAFRASQQGGGEFRMWTPQLYLCAAIVNLLNAANRQRAGKRTPRPLVKPPSQTQKQKPRVVTVASIAARQRREAEHQT